MLWGLLWMMLVLLALVAGQHCVPRKCVLICAWLLGVKWHGMRWQGGEGCKNYIDAVKGGDLKAAAGGTSGPISAAHAHCLLFFGAMM